MIRFLTFEQIHNKKGAGSTNIRVHNLIKYWPEAGVYKYGENPDVMVFQKVYQTQDYKFHQYFKGIKILDICDPDWLDGVAIKETVDAVDGVTCPTEPLAEFVRQFTDKPVRVIPDRHDVVSYSMTPPLHHRGKAKTAVWFGYKHNASTMQFAVPTLEKLGLDLTIISNEEPYVFRWADDPDAYLQEHYKYIKYDQATIIKELQKADICVLPKGSRPVDRFKSDNKTTLAWLAGLPVAKDGDDVRRFLDPAARQDEVSERFKYAKEEYDCRKSVDDLKEFISELKELRK